MDYKEAKGWIQHHFDPGFDDAKQDEALNVVLDALDKQVPIKLRKTKEMLICPRCKRTITSKYKKRSGMNYCCKCGQALCWDNVVEEVIGDEGPEAITFTLHWRG